MENPNNSDNTIIGNCLSCQGLVRVPAKAPVTSKVRCPHCTSSFLLSQILDQAVPELELVDDGSSREFSDSDLQVDTGGASKDDAGRFVVAPQLRSGSKKPRSRKSEEKGSGSRRGSSNSRSSRRGSSSRSSERSSERSSSYDSEKIEVEEPVDLPDPPPGEFAVAESEDSDRRSSGESRRSRSRSSEGGSRENSRRPKRPRKSKSNSYENAANPAVEIFKVMLGGFLAIPIAYLLVLWVFGKDPLQVGPTIGKTVPFMVPAEYRPEEESAEGGASPDEANGKSGSSNSEPASTEPDILDVSTLPLPSNDPSKVGKN